MRGRQPCQNCMQIFSVVTQTSATKKPESRTPKESAPKENDARQLRGRFTRRPHHVQHHPRCLLQMQIRSRDCLMDVVEITLGVSCYWCAALLMVHCTERAQFVLLQHMTKGCPK